MGTPITAFPIQTENPSELPAIAGPVVGTDQFVATRGGAILGTILASLMPTLASLAGSAQGQGADLVTNAVRFCTTITTLRGLGSSILNPTCAIVGGNIEFPDCYGSIYVYKSTDTTTADNGFSVIVDAANRRWYRIGQTKPIHLGAPNSGNGNNPVFNSDFGLSAFIAGQIITFVPIANCIAAASSITIGITGPFSLQKDGSTQLNPGDLVTSQLAMAVFTGAAWVLIGASTQSTGQSADVVPTATVDLGALKGDSANLVTASVVAITSFGSPIAGSKYRLRLQGASITIVEGGTIITGRGTIGQNFGVYLVENVLVGATVFSYVSEIYAASGGLVQGDVAATADVQAATPGLPQALTPSSVQASPYAVKAWVKITGASGGKLASFGIGTVTRNGTGDYTVNFSPAMIDANYVIQASAGGGGPFMIDTDAAAPTVNACRITVFDHSNVAIDPTFLSVSVSGH